MVQFCLNPLGSFGEKTYTDGQTDREITILHVSGMTINRKQVVSYSDYTDKLNINKTNYMSGPASPLFNYALNLATYKFDKFWRQNTHTDGQTDKVIPYVGIK